MRHDFGIRVAAEYDSRIDELALQFDVVFDDAVVNDGHITRQMRMRILLIRATVCGPTRVTDTGRAADR